MQIKIDLTTLWNQYVARGLVKNSFQDKFDRQLEAGVRLAAGGPELYIIDLSTGTDICPPPQLKKLDNGMELQFTPVASLKPSTPPTGFGRQADLSAEAIACRLACQDRTNPLSILNREPVVHLKLSNSEWRAVPNVAPWERRGHLLWVPTKLPGEFMSLPHRPQMLNGSFVEDFLEIGLSDEKMITFFTSLHAGASANHIHFQSIYREAPLAAQFADRFTLGRYTVLKGYAASGLVFPREVQASILWQPIEKIQTAGYPFNMIMLANGIYVFVRKPEHEIVEEFPGRPLGAIEFAGHINTADQNDFARVTPEVIESAYAKSTLDYATLAKVLG